MTHSNLEWKLRITQSEDWWKISNSSARSGELEPGAYETIFVEVDRTGKADGDYHGFFYVDSEGDHYGFSERVNLTMEVGEPPQPEGPELRNISTNFGNALNQLRLSFNTKIDPASARSSRNYLISPDIHVEAVSVDQEHVTLTTADHELERIYSITVKSITNQQGISSLNITGSYQFFPNLAGADLWQSGTEEEYRWDNAVTGKQIYTDRMIKLGEVPENFQGCALLRSAWADGANSTLNLKFTILRGTASVLLAIDPQKNPDWNCDWLTNQFHAISDSFPVEGSPVIDFFTLLESNRIYQPGDTVSLFQNGAPDLTSFMYFALVRPASGTLTISGAVNYHFTGRPVANTQLALTGHWTDTTLSGADGEFLLPTPVNSDILLVPSRTGDLGSRTISMYDAALAARIANDLFPTATEAQRQTADANTDGHVTWNDALEIARFTIGLPPGEFHRIGTWQFLPPSRQYFALASSLTQQDFTALVVGDVDASWQPAISSVVTATKQSGSEIFDFTAGREANHLFVAVALNAESAVSAFELEVNYPSAGLELDRIQKNPVGAAFEILAREAQPGNLKLGGFTSAPVNASGECFRIWFRADETSLSGEKIEIRHAINGVHNAPVTLNSNGAPVNFRLMQNFPNPFNPQTRIEYELAHSDPQPTVILIFNAAGQVIRTLVNQSQSAGRYVVEWNGLDTAGLEVASGVYLVSIESGSFRQVIKMVKLR